MGNGTEATSEFEQRKGEPPLGLLEKILAMRLEFHQSEIKKSGFNTFAKYNYFELGDFVLPILKLCDKYRVFTHVTFSKEVATLVVTNIDDRNEAIYFTSPMGGAELKGIHEIQQIGAVETYQRRYLYVLFMDIVEHDAIDSAPPQTYRDQAYTAMRQHTTLEGLQKTFAAWYRGASQEDQSGIKKDYDSLKSAFDLPGEENVVSQ